MKDKRKSKFSLSKYDNDYFGDGEDKIELVKCPRGGVNCSEHRFFINKHLLASHKFHVSKDYHRSIEALKLAYDKTTDLREPTCLNCAILFRCMVTQTLENIHDDLHQMAKGLLFNKRYQSSYEFAGIVLKEFKAEG